MDSKTVEKLARKTWTAMRHAAVTKGMRLDKREGEDGYFLPTTVSTFIRAVADDEGVQVVKEDIDQIRKYLRWKGNVVSGDLIDPNDQYGARRVFIRSQWNDGGSGVKKKYAPQRKDRVRLTNKDLGEDREPGEVTVKMQPLTRKQVERVRKIAGSLNGNQRFYVTDLQRAVLLTLAKMGGQVNQKGGNSSAGVHLQESLPEGMRESNIAHCLRNLEDYRLVEIKKASPRRIHTVSLTVKGWKVANVMMGKKENSTEMMREKEKVEKKEVVVATPEPTPEPAPAPEPASTTNGHSAEIDQIKALVRNVAMGEMSPLTAIAKIEEVVR